MFGYIGAISLLVGCGDDGGTSAALDASGPLRLVDHTAWTTLEPSLDVFPTHRPTNSECPSGAIYESHGVLEIETNLCHYVSLGQPLAAAVSEGEVLRFPLWHLQLFNAEPAEAHLALVFGTDVLVDYTTPIPSAAHIETREVMLARDYPAGTAVQLHLHNHGENHWRVGPIDLIER